MHKLARYYQITYWSKTMHSEPMLGYCQLDHQKHTEVKLETKHKMYHSRIFIWKYRLRNDGHFVQGVIEGAKYLQYNTKLINNDVIYTNERGAGMMQWYSSIILQIIQSLHILL